MSIISTRQTLITFQGDVNSNFTIAAASNSSTPAGNYLIYLAAGNNTIQILPGLTGITFYPQPTNTTAVILKGSNSDTGVAMHKTDHTSLALDPSTTAIVLNVVTPIFIRFVTT
jgi:hypothetical protein